MLSPKAEIRPATDEDIVRYYGGIEFKTQWVGEVVAKGSLVAGFGGLLELEEGVWFAVLEVPAAERRPSVYRHVLAAFKAAREKGAVVIKAHCSADIPRARELMERLGFVETDEIMADKKVWECRASR
jgi:hypothetical protein